MGATSACLAGCQTRRCEKRLVVELSLVLTREVLGSVHRSQITQSLSSSDAVKYTHTGERFLVALTTLELAEGSSSA